MGRLLSRTPGESRVSAPGRSGSDVLTGRDPQRENRSSGSGAAAVVTGGRGTDRSGFASGGREARPRGERSAPRYVLVVAQDRALCRNFVRALGEYRVRAATSFATAAQRLRQEIFDLVVVAEPLRDLDERRLVSTFRGLGVGALFILARVDDPVARAHLLLAGADVVSLPVAMVELAARAGALLRRRTSDHSLIRISGLEIDMGMQEARVERVPARLTPTEFRLLAFLATRAGRPCSRQEILRQLWRSNFAGNPRVCDVFVSCLLS